MTSIELVIVLGARPQFIKAAPVIEAVNQANTDWSDTRVSVTLIHTGQHYDTGMSQIFFDELQLPVPGAHLGVGSAPPATQTAQMMERLEPVLLDIRPDAMIVFGDTNSTLAGGLTAAKNDIPVAHVEAGLRSFNRSMPEELNRVLVDRLSDLLLCPSNSALKNLEREGITLGTHITGDVMLEVMNRSRPNPESALKLLNFHGLQEGKFAVATIHRAENTDSESRLQAIFAALNDLSEDMPVVVPLHPRTRKAIDGRISVSGVRLIEPVGHREMIALAGAAQIGLTDSGGLQKELYWLGVPCVTLRDETEWIETVDAGWNVVAGADRSQIAKATRDLLSSPPGSRPPVYGTGDASRRIVETVVNHYSVES